MEDVQLIVESIQSFVKRKVPIRFGLVPLTKTTAALEQAKVIYHLLDAYGLPTAITYLESVRLNSSDYPLPSPALTRY